MGSREFQLNYQRLDEPVQVVRKGSGGGRPIGYFYPGANPPITEKHLDLEKRKRGR